MQLVTAPNGLLKRKLLFQSRSPNDSLRPKIRPPHSHSISTLFISCHFIPVCTCRASQMSRRSDNRAKFPRINLTCDRRQDGMMRNRCHSVSAGTVNTLERLPHLRATSGASGSDLPQTHWTLRLHFVHCWRFLSGGVAQMQSPHAYKMSC